MKESLIANNNELRFDGKVVVVTGAGGGLGREYALLFGSRGASVVVNDLGGSRSGEGKNQKAADLVVDEIRRKGGKAVANYDSVEEGHKIIDTAINNFGRIDILINNAGILRDKSFLKISEEDWDLIHRVHLRGSFLVTKAAWPYFRKQNYGRIIMTASCAGIFGNFGQSNYSSAKLGLIGLSNTLAIEGAKYNISCNTIIPVAASRLTQDILPPNLFNQLKPSYVAPIVVWLCHEECTENGGVFEAAGGWVGKYRWQRSLGKAFIPPDSMSPEAIRDNWSTITNMANARSPKTIHEQMSDLVNALSGNTPTVSEATSSITQVEKPGHHSYSENDTILYALGVGVSTNQKDHLKYLYENHERFSVLPTFAVIPSLRCLFEFGTISEVTKSMNIAFDPTKLLHGEQYLELYKPIPSRGHLFSEPRVVDVLDKGSGAVIIAEVTTRDENGEALCLNQFSLFLVGSGNFGGKRISDKPEVKNIINPPKRQPDAIVSERTSIDQAALYRLSGDKNPLHIDPAFAAVGGFDKPILHGLCSLGFATRHVLGQYADNDVTKFRAVKVRFSGTIIPGETIETKMWKEGNRIYFESFVKETGKPVISGAYINLSSSGNDTSDNNNDKEEIDLNSFDLQEDFTSVPIFEEMGRRVQMIPNISQKVNTIYEFVVTKNGENPKTKIWTLDLKSPKGTLYEGHSKGGPPNCVIKLSDEDMTALAMNALNPVEAFMKGRIKIQGNPVATQKLQMLFEKDSSDTIEGVESSSYFKKREEEMKSAPASVSSQTPQPPPPPAIQAQSSDGSGGDGSSSGNQCKIDTLFENWLPKRMEEMRELIPVIKTVYQWNITKNGKVTSVWTCDFKNGNGAVYRGAPKTGRADCTLTLDDDFGARIFEGREDPMKAFMSGKLKITGNILAAQKLQQLWAEEAPKGLSIEEAAKTASKPTKSASDGGSDRDIDEIPSSGYKGDIFFHIFRSRMHEEPDFMKRLRVVFQFNILKDGKPACIWTADNKTTNQTQVYRSAPKNVKPDCLIVIEDDDMLKVLTGRLNPQRLFMMGKVKVKGNIMLLQKLNSLWTEFLKLGKAPELPHVVEVLIDDPLIPGLKSESTAIDLIQRLARLPEIRKDIPGVYVFHITKEGKVVSSWKMDLKPDGFKFLRGTPTATPRGVLTLDDLDFARLVMMKMSLPDAIAKGKVKCEGDKDAILKLSKLFSTPTSLKPKL